MTCIKLDDVYQIINMLYLLQRQFGKISSYFQRLFANIFVLLFIGAVTNYLRKQPRQMVNITTKTSKIHIIIILT